MVTVSYRKNKLTYSPILTQHLINGRLHVDDINSSTQLCKLIWDNMRFVRMICCYDDDDDDDDYYYYYYY